MEGITSEGTSPLPPRQPAATPAPALCLRQPRRSLLQESPFLPPSDLAFRRVLSSDVGCPPLSLRSSHRLSCRPHLLTGPPANRCFPAAEEPPRHDHLDGKRSEAFKWQRNSRGVGVRRRRGALAPPRCPQLLPAVLPAARSRAGTAVGSPQATPRAEGGAREIPGGEEAPRASPAPWVHLLQVRARGRAARRGHGGSRHAASGRARRPPAPQPASYAEQTSACQNPQPLGFRGSWTSRWLRPGKPRRAGAAEPRSSRAAGRDAGAPRRGRGRWFARPRPGCGSGTRPGRAGPPSPDAACPRRPGKRLPNRPGAGASSVGHESRRCRASPRAAGTLRTAATSGRAAATASSPPALGTRALLRAAGSGCVWTRSVPVGSPQPLHRRREPWSDSRAKLS
ncbi:somatostatin receptor type 2 isoform X1 [Struthio camelus]|uniref:somatostatin receptor type 2 isoform X1 n=1 Tax=Struthio camelus TaxID=8801 RepID=UPI003603C4C1